MKIFFKVLAGVDIVYLLKLIIERSFPMEEIIS